MSQFIKLIKADKYTRYLFEIALDHIPEPQEEKDLEKNIGDAMDLLGVPRDQVETLVFKSDVPPEVEMPQDEVIILKKNNYLLCILVRVEQRSVQQNPDVVSQNARLKYAKFAGLDPDHIAALVLENAYLEVQTRYDGPRRIGVHV